jgi:hypothetical protein
MSAKALMEIRSCDPDFRLAYCRPGALWVSQASLSCPFRVALDAVSSLSSDVSPHLLLIHSRLLKAIVCVSSLKDGGGVVLSLPIMSTGILVGNQDTSRTAQWSRRLRKDHLLMYAIIPDGVQSDDSQVKLLSCTCRVKLD